MLACCFRGVEAGKADPAEVFHACSALHVITAVVFDGGNAAFWAVFCFVFALPLVQACVVACLLAGAERMRWTVTGDTKRRFAAFALNDSGRAGIWFSRCWLSDDVEAAASWCRTVPKQLWMTPHILAKRNLEQPPKNSSGKDCL